MKRTWTIIGVRNVAASFKWYRSLFGQPETPSSHDYFDQVLASLRTERNGVAQLHEWSAHDHPILTSPDTTTSGNGLLLFFRVDDYDAALSQARTLLTQFEAAPPQPEHSNHGILPLRADGYYVTISGL